MRIEMLNPEQCKRAMELMDTELVEGEFISPFIQACIIQVVVEQEVEEAQYIVEPYWRHGGADGFVLGRRAPTGTMQWLLGNGEWYASPILACRWPTYHDALMAAYEKAKEVEKP